ncbi:unnamed protein product, partial [Choristocarpus tenellus]
MMTGESGLDSRRRRLARWAADPSLSERELSAQWEAVKAARRDLTEVGREEEDRERLYLALRANLVAKRRMYQSLRVPTKSLLLLPKGSCGCLQNSCSPGFGSLCPESGCKTWDRHPGRRSERAGDGDEFSDDEEIGRLKKRAMQEAGLVGEGEAKSVWEG